jgi:hypothetical protein
MSDDGKMFAAGCYNDNGGVGATYIYEFINNEWVQGQKIIASGASGNAAQGSSVALAKDKNVLVIGGYIDDANKGAIWIFTREGLTFTQVQKLVGTNGSASSRQGFSLAISSSGNMIATSGYDDSSSSGSVWIFYRENSQWVQKGNKLVGTNMSGNSIFGYSLAMNGNGNVLAISCPGDASSLGGFFMYVYDGEKWVQKGNNKTVPSGLVSSTTLVGLCVAMDKYATVLAVGAPLDNTDIGAAYIFN